MTKSTSPIVDNRNCFTSPSKASDRAAKVPSTDPTERTCIVWPDGDNHGGCDVSKALSCLTTDDPRFATAAVRLRVNLDTQVAAHAERTEAAELFVNPFDHVDDDAASRVDTR